MKFLISLLLILHAGCVCASQNEEKFPITFIFNDLFESTKILSKKNHIKINKETTPPKIISGPITIKVIDSQNFLVFGRKTKEDNLKKLHFPHMINAKQGLLFVVPKGLEVETFKKISKWKKDGFIKTKILLTLEDQSNFNLVDMEIYKNNVSKTDILIKLWNKK